MAMENWDKGTANWNGITGQGQVGCVIWKMNDLRGIEIGLQGIGCG